MRARLGAWLESGGVRVHPPLRPFRPGDDPGRARTTGEPSEGSRGRSIWSAVPAWGPGSDPSGRLDGSPSAGGSPRETASDCSERNALPPPPTDGTPPDAGRPAGLLPPPAPRLWGGVGPEVQSYFLIRKSGPTPSDLLQPTGGCGGGGYSCRDSINRGSYPV